MSWFKNLQAYRLPAPWAMTADQLNAALAPHSFVPAASNELLRQGWERIVKERPILFSAPMVRALLDGSKTQTRRVMKLQPEFPIVIAGDPHTNRYQVEGREAVTLAVLLRECPYGQPGDRLWVREAHAMVFEVDIPAGRPAGPIAAAGSPARPDWKTRYIYRADGEMPNVQWHHVGDSQPVRWTPSIHMPRAASRILLEIAGVHVERLNDCSDTDAVAEGIGLNSSAIGIKLSRPPGESMCVNLYRQLWESINGPGSWAVNPWVWVVEFKRVAT